MVVIKVVEQPGELLDAGETELQELKPLAQQVQLEDLQRMLTLLIKTEAELAQSNYPRLTMEMLLIRLAQMPPGQEVSVLIRKLELLEQRLAGTPLPPSPPAESPRPEPARAVSPPPPSGGGAQPKKVEAPPLEASADCDWAGLVDFVKSRRVRIGSFLEHGRLVSNQLPHLKVALPVSFYGLIDREMKEDIQQLATEFFSRPVKLDLVSLSDNQSAPPSLLEERKLQESDREKRLKSDAVEHPMVKAAIDIFEGEVDRVQPIDKGFV
jgi:DNA polymerase-3 subunit gamma/tau